MVANQDKVVNRYKMIKSAVTFAKCVRIFDSMQTATYIKILLVSLILSLAPGAYAVITIDSAAITPSRCANDGTITIYGHSATSLLYSIVSGPDIRIAQSGNQFSGLPHGSYQVMVTNFSNDTAMVPATVGGNYSFPDFAPTFADPLCAGTATGMIVGNAISTAKPPFTWTLTNVATSTTTTQASDSFLNLPAGTYSLKLVDSCQSFATRSVTLSDPNHTFTIGNINIEMYSCDTAQIYTQLYLPGGNYAEPYTIQVQTHNGTYQHVITNFSRSGWYPDFRERVPGVTYGDYVNFTITDACGYAQSIQNVISPFNPHEYFTGRTDTCQASFAIYLALGSNLPNERATYMHAPVTVVITDPATGTLIDSTVTDSDTLRRSSSIAFSSFIATGHTYHVVLTDGCGNRFARDYTWPVLAPPSVSHSIQPDGCFDSTASYSFYWYNLFYTLPTFELLSGPTSIHSTKPHYTYSDPISYPQTYQGGLASTTAVGSFIHGLSLFNLGVGTYRYRVYDSCGHSLTDSFTIAPQDVSDLHYSYTVIKGCPGENKVTISFNNNNYLSSVFLLQNQNLVANVFSSNTTVNNLDAGTYVLSLSYYRPQSVSVNQNQNCWVINDTIVIPPYQLPQVAYATQVKCNGLVNVGLQPDSSKGIPPYQYEILSGPQTFSVQASNFFALTQPGTYVARIQDTCGFAQTFTFSVDTLSFQQIVKVGSSCLGNSATLIAQHSPYSSYHWQRPDGTFYNGDTLVLNPVHATDYGVYHITKYVSVNGCRDTFYTTYTLTSNAIGNISTAICSGQSVTFGGAAYTTPGIYYDTVRTTGCDSISILTLTIRTGIYDSTSRAICSGQSVTVGTHVYSATGVYRDTIATTGCDTIHVLNLTITSMKRDSVIVSICPGQSVIVGPHTYTTTGIYRDTFSTAGCDSLHILDLRVGTLQRDTFIRSICTGQTVTFGSHVYSTTGIYRDTLPTGSCGLIILLDLQVSGVKRDSVSQSICAGQSITVGPHIYNTAGIYRDTFSTVGCDSVHILRLQVAAIKRDSVSRSICPGQSITVGAHTYSTAGVYRDTLTSSAGCDSIFILNLGIGGVKRDTTVHSLCAGESIVIDGVPYSQLGVYSDTFATGGCDSIHSVRISVYPRPHIEIVASSTDVSVGDTIQLNISGSAVPSYHWSSSATLSDPSIPNPTAIISQSAWIIVEAVDTNNCSAVDSILIQLVECDGSVFVPNAFTPNGDGRNDLYRVFARCAELNSLKIFNRWGEKVWETEDINQGWDGTYRGSAQPTEVYVYLITYRLLSDKSGVSKHKQGSITLIR